MLIDFHIHMFPPRPEFDPVTKPNEAMLAIKEKTPGELKNRLIEMGVSHAVVQHVSPAPELTKLCNEFAGELAAGYDGFYFQYGAYHAGNSPDDLYELKESGVFQGVKLQPYLQRFDVDDSRMYPAYEVMSSLKLPVLIHTGRDLRDAKLSYGFPDRVAKIHRDFPDLTIISAHLGGMWMYDEAEQFVVGTDMYIDVTGSVFFCDPARYKKILDRHDPDRILFGSDCPAGTPQKELEFLERLNLGSDRMEKILYKNAQRLLGI